MASALVPCPNPRCAAELLAEGLEPDESTCALKCPECGTRFFVHLESEA